MADSNKLEERSVEDLISRYSFIVPEIQREYVWGNNEYDILDKFFKDIRDARNDSSKDSKNLYENELLSKLLATADGSEKAVLENLVQKSIPFKDLNIGFLYSYRPYYNYNQEFNDVFLIDGQQRLTTLFLSLYYFALKENKVNDFVSMFRFDNKKEKIAFDYRVRTLTHNYLIELLTNCRSLEDIEEISSKTWYLADFANDITIKAINGTLKRLHTFFKEDTSEYYDFIKSHVRFWHFKTEETSQGEELYITMNSRGQQLADNETIRAKLFEDEKIKSNQIQWGENWENWQDFFWTNKLKNGNADLGFNQFLRWANIAYCFSTQKFKTKEDAEKEYKRLLSENTVLDYVSLFEIKPYFDALLELTRLKASGNFAAEQFKNNFNSEWLATNISQIHLIKLLPALIFLKSGKPIEELNRYIRFFSNLTNDIDIAKNPDTYIIEAIRLTKAFADGTYVDVVELVNFQAEFPILLNGEEMLKLEILKKQDDVKRQSLEKLFWQAEDFKINKGKIGHLLQMSAYAGTGDTFSYKKNFDYSTITNIDLTRFLKIFIAFKELVDAENDMWGDLLTSNVYLETGDRVFASTNWHLTNGFLHLVFEREANKAIPLEQFLIGREKKFIKSYLSEAEIIGETNCKNQLFLYYILHERILNQWNWKRWNFGIYESDNQLYPKSLFLNGKIYQMYNSQWRYNIGYVDKDGIWIQDNYSSKRNYVQELIDWANK